ncbi:unnamed protein product, partial [Urochloa humidicola]
RHGAGRVARLVSTIHFCCLPARGRNRPGIARPNQKLCSTIHPRATATSTGSKYLPTDPPPRSSHTRHGGHFPVHLPRRNRQSTRNRKLSAMAMVASTSFTYHKPRFAVVCRKNKDGRDKEKEKEHKHPFKVVEITPPPRCLGVRCFPTNIHCGESVMIEGQAYTVSAVTHRYQLRKGRYEPSEKRLDVLSTGRYILNLYLQNLLDQS